MRQSTEAFGILSVPWGCSRSSHLENGALFSCSLCLTAFLGVWVLFVGYSALDSSGDDFVRRAMLGLTLDSGLATVLSFCKNFSYFLRRRGLGFWRFFSCRMEKYAQSMLRFEPLHAQFALGEQTLFLRVYEFDLCDDVGHFSCSVRIFRTRPSGIVSPQFFCQLILRVCGHTHSV